MVDNKQLREIEAIRATFEELASYGIASGKDQVTVDMATLVTLEEHIDKLHRDLKQASAHLTRQ
jgi:low affinity Fe/Cu permease